MAIVNLDFSLLPLSTRDNSKDERRHLAHEHGKTVCHSADGSQALGPRQSPNAVIICLKTFYCYSTDRESSKNISS